MLKHIYPATLVDGRTCGFSLEQYRQDFLSTHPDASPCDPIRVTAQQFAEWKATGSWEEDWGNGRFIEAGSLPRWGLDLRDPHTPTPEEYAMLFAEAANADDRDAFVSDWALSTFWRDPPESEIPEQRIAWLKELWRKAHFSVGEICQFAALSHIQLSQRSLVPYSTLLRWSGDDTKFSTRDRYYLLHLTGLLPEL